MEYGMSKKIVVLGNGILGKEISKQTGWDNISREKNGFDITDNSLIEEMMFDQYDVIINCIANTNTYLDERDPHWNVNYKGVDNLVEFCNREGIKLVHVSTDYVYVNAEPNSSEEDVPVHQGTWYAYTKLLGDSHVQLKSKDYLIVRGGHKPNPFPYDNAKKTNKNVGKDICGLGCSLPKTLLMNLEKLNKEI